MRLAAAVVGCWLLLAAQAVAKAEDAPALLAAARQAYEANLRLGDSLGGAPASPEQADQARALIAEGLQAARAAAAADPRAAEARRLAGALLCLSYQPVESRVIAMDEETGEVRRETIVVLRREPGDSAEEGLAEFRAALRLEPRSADCRLDYAEALALCGQPKAVIAEATALWERRADLTVAQRARAARLLASAARSLDTPADEVRWLRELLAADPDDKAAAARLAEIAPPAQPGIAWQSYEAGLGQARQEGKPVFIHFTTVWCGWCRRLEQEAYARDDVIALSRDFACVKVDGDRRPDLVRAHRIEGYPTLLFLDPQGREISRVPGYIPADRLLAEMRRALPPRQAAAEGGAR